MFKAFFATPQIIEGFTKSDPWERGYQGLSGVQAWEWQKHSQQMR